MTDSKPLGLRIAVVSEKGGAGKSTLTASLATYWKQTGLRVACVDVDDQKTLETWAAVGVENGYEPPFVVSLSKNVRTAGPEIADRYDITLMDCPGSMSPSVDQALLVCDLVVVPVVPGGPDSWGLHRTLRRVAQAQGLRPELKAAFLPFRALNTTLSRRALAEYEEAQANDGLFGATMRMSPVAVKNAAAIADAMAAGTGATVWKGGSEAALQLTKVAMWIEEWFGVEEALDSEEDEEVASAVA